jgi:hypothetical protein
MTIMILQMNLSVSVLQRQLNFATDTENTEKTYPFSYMRTVTKYFMHIPASCEKFFLADHQLFLLMA